MFRESFLWVCEMGKVVDGTVSVILAEMEGEPPGLEIRRSWSLLKETLSAPMK